MSEPSRQGAASEDGGLDLAQVAASAMAAIAFWRPRSQASSAAAAERPSEPRSQSASFLGGAWWPSAGTGSEDSPRSLSRPSVFDVLFAVREELPAVRKRLETVAGEAAPGEPDKQAQYNTVLQAALRLVETRNDGCGVTLIVASEDLEMQYTHTDGGMLTRCFWDFARSVTDDSEAFLRLWRAFRKTGSGSECWEIAEIKDLVQSLSEVLGRSGNVACSDNGDGDAHLDICQGSEQHKLLHDLSDRLVGQPKEGALWLTLDGEVRAAAVHLLHVPSSCRRGGLCGAGASAVAVAEMMGRERISGALFVKTDGGSLHVLTPQPSRPVPPQVINVILPLPGLRCKSGRSGRSSSLRRTRGVVGSLPPAGDGGESPFVSPTAVAAAAPLRASPRKPPPPLRRGVDCRDRIGVISM